MVLEGVLKEEKTWKVTAWGCSHLGVLEQIALQ